MAERSKRKKANELKQPPQKAKGKQPVEEEPHLEEEEKEENLGREEFGEEEKKEDFSEKDDYGNEIFSTSYLGKATRKVELLSRMKILSETLKRLNEIGCRRKILSLISGQLNSNRLIGNQDREIRLLSAACILDILRLFAPDVPYSSEELCDLFEALTVMLRGFSTYDPNSAQGSCLFYLLSSLSTVRSCAILVFLAQQNIPSANERLKEFIEALISSIRTDHSEAVKGHIGNILETCIFECEKFDQEFLDILLSPLLPSSKTENPAAYHLSQSVLARCTPKLQPSMSSFINHILVGGIQEVSHLRADESNLSEDVYTIIYEISKISPNYLLHILPNICVQLQAEEPEMRLEVVKLLGKLFSSPHANYGRDFLKSFKDFLGRFVDISISVRMEMIESAYLIFVHHSDLRQYLEEHICLRLRDNEAQVRYAALSKLLEIFSEDPTQLQVHTIKEIAERVKDKKQDIRKIAQIGLSKVYGRHISHQILLGDGLSQLLEEGEEEQEESDLSRSELHLQRCLESCPRYEDSDSKERKDLFISESLGIKTEIWSRLEFVPGYLLNCWGYPDPLDKHLVLQLFQEHILPKPRRAVLQEEEEEISRIVPSRKRKSSDKTDTELSSCSSFSRVLSIARRSKATRVAMEWECRRASLLLRIFAGLDATQRTCLGALLVSKAKVRAELSEFVTKWSKSSKGSQKEAAIEMQRASFRLLQSFPPSLAATEKKTAVLPIPLEKLYQSKDKTLQKLLLAATEPFPSDNLYRHASAGGRQQSNEEEEEASPIITRSCSCREELKQRLDSKSSLGSYMARVFDTSAVFMVANLWTVRCLLFHLLSTTQLLFDKHHAQVIGTTSGRQRERLQQYLLRESCNTAELLTLLAKYLPLIFEGCAEDLNEWLESICALAPAEGAENEAEHWHSVPRSALLSHLENLVKFTAKFLKLPCLPLRITAEESEEAVRSLSSNLLSHSLSSQNPSLCEVLAETVQKLIRGQPSVASASALTPELTADTGDSSELQQQLSQICDDFGVTTALKKLCTPQRLSVNAPLQRLSCDFHTMAALLSSYGQSARELTGISTRALQFLSTSVFNATSAFHSKRAKEELAEEAYLLTLIGGIKLWLQLSIRETVRESLLHGTSGLHGSNEFSDEEGQRGEERGETAAYALKESQSLSDRFPAYLVDFLELLFSVLQSYGSKVLDLRISSSERQAKVREVSTVCLIQMLAIKAVGKGINTQEWQLLAWTFLDDNERCRRNIFHAFSVLIQTHCIHPRFLAFPCLLASDLALSHTATQSLLFTIRRLNKTHLDLCEKAMEAQERAGASGRGTEGSSEEKDHYVSLAKVNSPECMIPYLLYLLANHPDFPTSISISSEGDEERLKALYRSIKMMYSVILQSVGAMGSNSSSGNDNNTLLSILLKQLQMILQFYRDRTHTNSTANGNGDASMSLQFVLRIALYVLEGSIKTQIQPFPGDINLPMDLFELKKKSASVSSGKGKLDESSVTKAIAILSRLEGQRGKHHLPGTTLLKRSPEAKKKSGGGGGGGGSKKTAHKKADSRSSGGSKRKSSPEKERKRSSVSVIARPRRSATAAAAVSYADTRDSDDEAEMEKIEEQLEISQTFSIHSSATASSRDRDRGKRSLSSGGSRLSAGSNASVGSASERLSMSSLDDTSESTFAKKRKLSGGLSLSQAEDPSSESANSESPRSSSSSPRSTKAIATQRTPRSRDAPGRGKSAAPTISATKARDLESGEEEEEEPLPSRGGGKKGKKKSGTLEAVWAKQKATKGRSR